MAKEKVIVQLKRTEGQLRGIVSMIEQDRGLVATMQQFMAARSALRRAMMQYVALFLETGEDGGVRLTPEQVEYVLKLIDS